MTSLAAQRDLCQGTGVGLSGPCLSPAISAMDSRERSRRLADPGFGRVFTDHMAVVKYSEGKGWHDARITARKPLSIDPAC